MQKLGDFIRSYDIFGHKISVHLKGDDSFKSLVGSIASTIVFALILSNLVNLCSAFMDGSRQEEKSIFQVYERQGSPSYSLAAQNFRITPFVSFEKSEWPESESEES